MIVFSGTTEEHILWVSEHLRVSDREELAATNGMPVYDTIKYSVLSSLEVLTALDVDEPFAIFGVAAPSLISRTGTPWMLATDRAAKFPLALVKMGRRFVADWSRRYDVLMNFVHVRNKKSVRWLEAIGFTIQDPIPWGVNGELFHPFFRLEHDHV